MADPYSPEYAGAISNIESGGNYGALGPQTKGDRAYGKYQIMGANIPQWTQEALGQPLTPDQFLASPQAQDAVFQFKFGQYVNKYGPEGAAKAWFAGEKGMNNPNAKDVLGTSVNDYAAKFMKGLGQAQPQPTVAGAPMPAFSWSPTAQPQVQAQPQAQPQPQQADAPIEMPQISPLQLAQIYYAPRKYQAPTRGLFSKG